MNDLPFALPGWARIALAAALAVLLAGLAVSWNQPLLDQHDFRQTQTVLSAYWMTRGGPLFLYETPLFGPPWIVPFEFPLYQWLVAALAGSGLPISLDQAARLVSVAALVGCLWPLRVSLRQFGATPNLVASASVLFLVAPIHAFWGRAAMVESLALLLALGFLAVLQVMVARRNWSYVAVAAVLATAAILVKVTTFLAFAALAGAVVAAALVADGRSRDYRRALALAIAAALPMAIALASLLAWLHASDAIKESSPLTAWLGSGQLNHWNYGTFAQKISSKFWYDALLVRMIPDILGYAAWPALALLLFSFSAKDKRGMWLWYTLPLVLFLLPMLVFTNLHTIHNYYQMANAVFLVVFLAAVVEYASRGRARWVSPTLTLACAIGMVAYGALNFLPTITPDRSNHPVIELARLLRAQVSPDDVIVVAGQDWSASLPYYAQRRAIMLRREIEVGFIPAALPTREQPRGTNIGALVQCGPGADYVMRLTDRLGPNPERLDVGGCTVLMRR